MSRRALRQFYYLNQSHLMSLSAQLFQGHLESETRREGRVQQEGTELEGPAQSTTHHESELREEQRSPKDFSYTQFEDSLTQDNLLVRVTADTIREMHDRPGLVSAEGPVQLIDAKLIVEAARTLPTVVADLARLQAGIPDALSAASKSPKNELTKTKKILESQVQPIASIIQSLYGGRFVVRLLTDTGPVCVAVLKEEWLRESPSALLRLLGPSATHRLTLVGIATRPPRAPKAQHTPTKKASSFLDGMQRMMEEWESLEGLLLETTSDEVVVDPIALYMTL